MIIKDKFNIIKINTNQYFDIEDISNWITDVFNKENTKTLHSYNIHQILYNDYFLKKKNIFDFVKMLKDSISKNIESRARLISSEIKRGKFKMKSLELVINKLLDNLEYIDKSLYLLNRYYDNLYPLIEYEYVRYPWGKSIVFKEGLKIIYTKFIDNFNIKKFINNELFSLDLDIKDSIINLNNFMLKLKIYSNDLYESYTNSLILNLKTLFIIDEDLVQNINMGIFQDIMSFNKIINIYSKLIDYYSFLENSVKEILTLNLSINISKYLCNILNTEKNYKLILNFCSKNIDQILLVCENLLVDDSTNESLKKYKTLNNNKNYNFNKIYGAINNFFSSVIPSSLGFNYDFERFLDEFNNIFNMYNKLEKIVKIDSKLLLLNDKNFCDDKEKISIICKVIHKKIINDHTDDDIEYCKNILKLTYSINKNQDIFLATYCKYLVQRLLNYKKIEFENKLIEILEDIKGISYVNKMKKMIYDISTSQENLENYNMVKINQVNNTLADSFKQENLNLVTFSYNVWDIALNKEKLEQNDIMNMPSQLKSYMHSFNQFYKVKYSDKRNLNWLFEMGSIELTLRVNDADLKIIASPYQSVVLELFNTTDSMSLTYIKNHPVISNLDDKKFNDLIKSLVVSRLFSISDDVLTFSPDNINQASLSLLDYYNNISDYEVKMDKQIEKQISLDRDLVLQVNIINLLKTNSLDTNEIQTKLETQMSTYFEVKEPEIKSCMETLIQKDYIQLNENKYVYVA